MLQSFISMAVITVVWVLVGFSLAFGDSQGGVIGNPSTYFLMKGVIGGAPGNWRQRSLFFCLLLSTQICHHYPGAGNRRFCRNGSGLLLYLLFIVLLCIHLLSAGACHLAPGRLAGQAGRAGFCRWYGGSYECRMCRTHQRIVSEKAE